MTAHDALIQAACRDDLDVIRAADPSLVDLVDPDGKTALFYALYRSGATTDDDRKTIAALLELGADPNLGVKRKDGGVRSPIHQAAIRSLSAVCKALVEAGAHTDEPGLLHAAAEGAVVWLVEECLKHAPVDEVRGGATAFHDACYAGSPDLVRLLLDRGADPTLTVTSGAWKGLDSLHFAIVGNDVEVVRILLGHGLRVHERHLAYLVDPERTWALPAEEREDVIAELLDADVDAQTGAAAREIAQLLRVRLDDDDVRRIAAEAAQRDVPLRPEVPVAAARLDGPALDVVAGLENSQPVAEVDIREALHEAARAGDADVLRRMLRSVDPNLSSPGNPTRISMPPLCAAAEAGQEEAVRVLLQAGADMSRRAANNKTAYRMAQGPRTRAVLRSFAGVGS